MFKHVQCLFILWVYKSQLSVNYVNFSLVENIHLKIINKLSSFIGSLNYWDSYTIHYLLNFLLSLFYSLSFSSSFIMIISIDGRLIRFCITLKRCIEIWVAFIFSITSCDPNNLSIHSCNALSMLYFSFLQVLLLYTMQSLYYWVEKDDEEEETKKIFLLFFQVFSIYIYKTYIVSIYKHCIRETHEKEIWISIYIYIWEKIIILLRLR